MQAIWNNTVIAESNDTVVVENNHYFPLDAIRAEYFVDSSHQTHCGWKGTAQYFSLVVNGKENQNAAWYYPEPKSEAANITGRIAFWKGVEMVT